MNIVDLVIVGKVYEFDCEFLTPNRRRTEMIGGIVREIITEGNETFIVLNDHRAISTQNITRVVGPYED